MSSEHEPHLEFNSFNHPSGATLTFDIAPMYRINNINGRAELTIQPIAVTDEGSYSCNFRNQQNQLCSRVVEVTFVNSVEFCTQNDLRYHATCGDSVTLECSAKNYDVLRWSKGQSNTAIDLSETHVSMNGTNLRISPVSVEDRGEYKCIAENKYFTAQDISATLEVYCEYLPSLPPSLPPSLFHAYTCMHVCYMCLRVCMYGTYVYVYACTVHAYTCLHVQNMCVLVCTMYARYVRICVCMCATCVYVYARTVHTCTCMHVQYMHIRVFMYSTCVYVYACSAHAYTYTYICMYSTCTVHVCTCMYVAIWYMHIRVCMYGTCVYVYACVLHVCTCIYMCVRVCM